MQVNSKLFSAVTVVPSDVTLLTRGVCRALHISVAGTLSVLMEDGTTGTFPVVPVGIFPIQVQRVNATGTAATGIVALY